MKYFLNEAQEGCGFRRRPALLGSWVTGQAPLQSAKVKGAGGGEKSRQEEPRRCWRCRGWGEGEGTSENLEDPAKFL